MEDDEHYGYLECSSCRSILGGSRQHQVFFHVGSDPTECELRSYLTRSSSHEVGDVEIRQLLCLESLIWSRSSERIIEDDHLCVTSQKLQEELTFVWWDTGDFELQETFLLKWITRFQPQYISGWVDKRITFLWSVVFHVFGIMWSLLLACFVYFFSTWLGLVTTLSCHLCLTFGIQGGLHGMTGVFNVQIVGLFFSSLQDRCGCVIYTSPSLGYDRWLTFVVCWTQRFMCSLLVSMVGFYICFVDSSVNIIVSHSRPPYHIYLWSYRWIRCISCRIR